MPLVVAHGGPGCTHDYVDSFRVLETGNSAVIHYDQFGNGRLRCLVNANSPGSIAFWVAEANRQ